MRMRNEFLATIPFDLYELHLFRILSESGSFTRAGQTARLTQSAITRQIRGMEDRLGIRLFERTTRHVALTNAGQMLYEKSGEILKATDDLLDDLRHRFNLVAPILRVGVARSIGLAALPGYFFAFRRKYPEVQLRVLQKGSNEILTGVESRELDVGLVCPPRRIAPSLRITHRFEDEFTIIVPPDVDARCLEENINLKTLRKRLENESWLFINRDGNTGAALHRWLQHQNWLVEPAMELDSFDLIVNLVALGLGVSMVPHRVLPLYANRREVRRIQMRPRFVRELAVIVRKNRNPPDHLTRFIEEVLF